MTYPRTLAAFAIAFGALVVWIPGSARADTATDCGLYFSGSEMCTVETSGGCTAQCTPINVQAQCAAQLEVNCTGSCSVTAEASCSGGCSADCSTMCSASPGSFNCEGYCNSDCSDKCTTECSSNSNVTQCQSSCTAGCSARCHGSCTATPPTADCMSQCQASCSGSCTAQANVNCDVMCQTSGFASCQTTVSGGCMAQCTAPTGALFCNGQYVNPPNLEKCAQDLNIMLSASGQCSGGTCTGTAAASCDASGRDAPLPGSLLAMGLCIAATTAVRRVRKRGEAA